MTSEADWQVVASQDEAPADATLSLEEEVTSQYVLVYLTSLPQVEEARYMTTLNEVSIR